MSQNKDATELEGSASLASNDSSVASTSSSKLQTRRTNIRSPQASSAVMEPANSPISSSVADKTSEEPAQQQIETTTAAAASTPTGTNGAGRVTRSQSVESNSNETTESRKRKRKSSSKSNTSNKKRAESHSASSNQITNSNGSNSASSNNINKSANNSNSNQDSERETRTSTQRQSKEAKEAKKAEREAIIKERLRQLEEVEQAVKEGTHVEYHRLLHDIEAKRAKMLGIAEMRRSLAEGNVLNFFNSQKYAAYSQYYWDKLTLRRSLIQQVQQKINLLEQEYYSNHVKSSLDDERLSEWVPPDRPSMISSLTLGLPEEDADNDVELARQYPSEGYYPQEGSRPHQQQVYQYAYTSQQQQLPVQQIHQTYRASSSLQPSPLVQQQQVSTSYPTAPTINEQQSQYRAHSPTNDNSSNPYYPTNTTTTSTRTTTSRTRDSPPLEMLTSLADRQYQKDSNENSANAEQRDSPFTSKSNNTNNNHLKREELPVHPISIAAASNNVASNNNTEPTTNSYTLPPINAWRYEQRPSLPTT